MNLKKHKLFILIRILLVVDSLLKEGITAGYVYEFPSRYLQGTSGPHWHYLKVLDRIHSTHQAVNCVSVGLLHQEKDWLSIQI